LVNGDATLNLWGYYTGVCTIVATGNITVNGWLVASDSTSHLALITTGTITTSSYVFWLQAVMYAHKSDNTGTIHLQGNPASISGSIAADNINSDNDVNLQMDSNLDISDLRLLRMPGL